MIALSTAGKAWGAEVSTTEKALEFPDELMAANIFEGSQDVVAHETVSNRRCVVLSNLAEVLMVLAWQRPPTMVLLDLYY